MINKIKNRLDEYLGFDNTTLYIDPLVRIFGGAIRDSIADMDINDIDILCGSHSFKEVENILLQNGYLALPEMSSHGISNLYQGIHVISYPMTFIKNINGTNRIVQLIKPRHVFEPIDTSKLVLPKKSLENYTENFKSLIENVDISSCGVSFGMENGELTLFENYENSILHCINKVFTVNLFAKMYSSTRCTDRIFKLENRGWIKIESTEQGIRDMKLQTILENSVEVITNKKDEFKNSAVMYASRDYDDGCYSVTW